MNLKVFTIVTHSDGYFEVLKESCIRHGINLEVLGWNEKYTGHMFKTEKTIEYLKSLKDDDIVLFVDGFDSIILGDPNVILETFLETNEKALFSQDFINDNKTLNFIQDCVNGMILINRKQCGPYRINSGMFIGYTKELLEIFEKSKTYVNEFNKLSNQRVLQDMCTVENNIKTDLNRSIMYNVDRFDTNFKVKNETLTINDKYQPLVISAPGNVSLDKICKLMGYEGKSKRTFFEYCQKYISMSKYKIVLLMIILFLIIICVYKFSF